MAALLGRRDFRGVLFVYFLWIFRCSFSVPRWSRLWTFLWFVLTVFTSYRFRAFGLRVFLPTSCISGKYLNPSPYDVCKVGRKPNLTQICARRNMELPTLQLVTSITKPMGKYLKRAYGILSGRYFPAVGKRTLMLFWRPPSNIHRKKTINPSMRAGRDFPIEPIPLGHVVIRKTPFSVPWNH